MASYAASSPVGAYEFARIFEGTLTRAVSRTTTRSSDFAVTATVPVAEGEWVELYDNDALTYEATGGEVVVRKLQTQGNIYAGVAQDIRAGRPLPDNNAVSSLATMLQKKYLAQANIMFPGMVGTMKLNVQIPANGDDIVIGSPVNLAYSLGIDKWKAVASGGITMIPLHHIEHDDSVAVNASIKAAVGMLPINVVA